MRITLTDGQNFINMDVDRDQSVQDVKALLEAETNIASAQISLFYQGNPLRDQDLLSSKQVGEGAVLYFVVGARPKPQQTQFKKGGIADMIKNFDQKIKSVQDQGYQFNRRRAQQLQGEAKRLIEQLGNDSMRLIEVEQTHPEIANAIRQRDVKGLAAIMHRDNQKRIKELKQNQRKFIQLSKDPMNPEYQRMLEERIRQENIDKNLQFANQYIPEVFGHITMLYIKASINKVPIQAFVDSGAQSTIMSQSLAERCGLMRLVDKRQAGRAVGVGSCKILGKIHAAEIQINGKFLTCSFTVIENNSTQFLLGLDMLRRFNCVIDLGKNTLNFQNGMIVTSFLSDGEVNKAKNSPLTQEELQVKLKKITDMGFSKAEALEALKGCGFNEQVAGNILMQRKYGGK